MDPRYLAAAGASGLGPGHLLGRRPLPGSDSDGASTVLLGVELVGGEIADTRFRMRRRVRAEDPTDLGAPVLRGGGAGR